MFATKIWMCGEDLLKQQLYELIIATVGCNNNEFYLQNLKMLKCFV